MQTENLTDVAKTVLAAIYAGGANVGQPYVTDLRTLGRQAGLTGDSTMQVENALRELVRKGISVEEGDQWFMASFITKLELTGEHQVSLVIGIPKAVLTGLTKDTTR